MIIRLILILVQIACAIYLLSSIGQAFSADTQQLVVIGVQSVIGIWLLYSNRLFIIGTIFFIVASLWLWTCFIFSIITQCLTGKVGKRDIRFMIQSLVEKEGISKGCPFPRSAIENYLANEGVEFSIIKNVIEEMLSEGLISKSNSTLKIDQNFLIRNWE